MIHPEKNTMMPPKHCKNVPTDMQLYCGLSVEENGLKTLREPKLEKNITRK